MKEIALPAGQWPPLATSFLGCLATILELPQPELPALTGDEDPAGGWAVSRWLGGLGLGIARVAGPAGFSWPGPWLALVRPPGAQARYVVMYGVPSGVVWDPGRYATRPVLRALVHRGGLRADIIGDGVIRVGDPVRVAAR